MADNNPTPPGGDTAFQTLSATQTTALASGISPTDPSLLALTTLFVQPPGCASIWAPTTVATSSNGTWLMATVLASDAADARFTSCQPSGWAANIPARAFSFSPAVCPSGWTYWGMKETINLAHNSPAYSTAFCCDRGYSPAPSWYALPTLTGPCIRSFGANEGILTIATAGTDSPSPESDQQQPHTIAAPITSGVLMHEGWHISWRSTDTSTLTPSLPALNSGQAYYLPL